VLERQALRLGVDPTMSPREGGSDPPSIATRCAVLARTDLVHHQQEGYTAEALWSGLCRGVARTALAGIFGASGPRGPIQLSGGLARVPEVVRWMRAIAGVEVVIPPDPECLLALGTAMAAPPCPSSTLFRPAAVDAAVERWPTLRPDPTPRCVARCRVGEIEVDAPDALAGDVALGLDVGSTSTKLAVLDLARHPLGHLYAPTRGDPVGATRRLLDILAERADPSLRVLGLGATGAGRHMLGALLAADLILDEISAHVRATAAVCADAGHIIEIGGQDGKSITLRGGLPVDARMNHLCAGGTGAFVEELAALLGFDLGEIASAVAGTSPPRVSHRCAVFMHRDARRLLAQGFSRAEVMGSVLYALASNHLDLAGPGLRHGSGPIVFLGATARNAGIVAAFERLLGRSVRVPDLCHVMGAVGVAQALLDRFPLARPTRFPGLTATHLEVRPERTTCGQCPSHCALGQARLPGRPLVTWGHRCGREPDAESPMEDPHFAAFVAWSRGWLQLPEQAGLGGPRVGLPLALHTWSDLPFWGRFFAELGARVVLSGPSDEAMGALAEAHGEAWYCRPIRLAHGHAVALARSDAADFVFAPHVVGVGSPDGGNRRSVRCPHGIALPSILRLLWAQRGFRPALLTPMVDLTASPERAARDLMPWLDRVMGATAARIRAAWCAAKGALAKAIRDEANLGRRALASLEGKGVVILGRPYLLHDPVLNQGIPQRVAHAGLSALPMDLLPLADLPLDARFPNVYWAEGRRLLAAAAYVRDHPDLHALVLSAHGCGPDAYLRSYLEAILDGRTFSVLEVDALHGAAGATTRVEAFCALVHSATKPAPRRPVATGLPRPKDASARTLWVPPMHPYGTPFVAAALRRAGVPAREMPLETPATMARGMRHCRAGVCCPAPATLGGFLEVLERSDAPSREGLFIPTAYGPCRYGQYEAHHRQVLEAAGYPDAHIDALPGIVGGGVGPASRQVYLAVVAADILYRLRCRLRPYALDTGTFDQHLQAAVAAIQEAFEHGAGLERALRRGSRDLAALPRNAAARPLVAVVGELYLRSNAFLNGDLVARIEAAGAEAWVEPMAGWFQYTALLDQLRAGEHPPLSGRLRRAGKRRYMDLRERSLLWAISPSLRDRPEPSLERILSAGESVFPRRFEGEPILTVGRALIHLERGVDLVFYCAPVGCMSGALVADALRRLEPARTAPVATLWFNGEVDLSSVVRSHLALLRSP
jgi:predicted CoA-substrate-specific enzyme activase